MNMKVENEMALPITKSVTVMLLEPYAGKLARTVLRGESSRKGADLLDSFTHNNCRNHLFMGNHCERHHSCSSNVNYVNKTIYLPSLENQVRPSCNKCYYCLLSFLGFKVTKMTTGLSSSFIFFSNSSSSFFLSGKRPVE